MSGLQKLHSRYSEIIPISSSQICGGAVKPDTANILEGLHPAAKLNHQSQAAKQSETNIRQTGV